MWTCHGASTRESGAVTEAAEVGGFLEVPEVPCLGLGAFLADDAPLRAAAADVPGAEGVARGLDFFICG